MTLHMQQAISTFRDQWTARFVDTITIDRLTDRGTFDDATGRYASPTNTAQYSGGALIRPSGSGSDADFEQVDTRVTTFDVYVPYTVTDVRPDDKISIVASLLATWLTGRTLTVVEVKADSYVTRRHLVATVDDPGSL